MKKFRNSIATLLAIACVAPTLVASVNSATVSPGQSFTATLSCGVNEGPVSVVGGNATVTSGANWCDRNSSITVTATAGGAGTASVSLIGGADCYNISDPVNPVSVSGAVLSSSSVSVVAPSNPGGGGNSGGGGTTTPPANNNTNNGSGNTTTTPNTYDSKKGEEKTDDKDPTNKLSSLKVSVGELSPKFDAETIVYDVVAPAGTSKISINATPASDKATIEGLGEKDVIVGDNPFEIICRAENGSATTYTIRVHVSEKSITTLTYGDKKLGVLNNGAAISNLFEEQKIKVNGKEVSAWVNAKANITLLYMQNEKTGEKDFYMYDTKSKKITSIYRPFAYNGKNYAMIDVPKKLQGRKGMKFTTVNLSEMKLPGWTFENSAFDDYFVLYVMDESGKIVYYQYDKKEDSLQRYTQAAPITQEEYEKLMAESDKTILYWSAIIGLGCTTFILFITTIVFYRKRNKSKYAKIKVAENSLSAEAKSLLHKVDD